MDFQWIVWTHIYHFVRIRAFTEPHLECFRTLLSPPHFSKRLPQAGFEPMLSGAAYQRSNHLGHLDWLNTCISPWVIRNSCTRWVAGSDTISKGFHTSDNRYVQDG